MADGFIVRKGGAVTEQALAPTITEVSTTATSITFTITNNDSSTAVILYELDDATPDENSIELAAAATSSNITITGLTEDVEYDVYATANVTGKVKSNVTLLAITAVEPIVYTAATGGTTTEYDSGGKRYKSHTFTSNGTFEVTTVGDATDDRNKVDYLIIAGGAGGGGNATALGGTPGGGGGAGGYRTSNGTSGRNSSAESKVTVTATSYSITIGAGGSAGSGTDSDGTNGVNTSALGITSTGGGGGAGAGSGVDRNGLSGGSGGGFSRAGNGGDGTANQGFDALDYTDSTIKNGGGGAGSLPDDFETDSGTNDAFGGGGAGLANLIRTGSNETRGVGGNGGKVNVNVSPADSGTANTGNGGNGANRGSSTGAVAGAGGSGIVVIRYEIAPTV
jgi:hypothetical protein